MMPPPAEPHAAEGVTERDFDFEAAFQRLAGTPCKVERIMLVGLQRTKAGVVQAELLRVKGARTLEEIRDAALEAYESLMALDVFDGVDLVVAEGANKSVRLLQAGPDSQLHLRDGWICGGK